MIWCKHIGALRNKTTKTNVHIMEVLELNGIKHILSLVLIVMLLSCPAYAMTVQEAKEAVLANDPKAVDAMEFWMSQSSETDGMWVIYATGIDKSTMDFEGGPGSLLQIKRYPWDIRNRLAAGTSSLVNRSRLYLMI